MVTRYSRNLMNGKEKAIEDIKTLQIYEWAELKVELQSELVTMDKGIKNNRKRSGKCGMPGLEKKNKGT